MNWADDDVFCHAVEQHGFSAAARFIARPRSWVSAAILRLESDLGTRLFERTTRQLRIASPYEFGAHHVAPAACAMMSAHPQLEVQLDVQHAPVSPLDTPHDIVFAMLDEPLPSSSIVIRRTLMLERSVFAAPSPLARHGEPRTPADLERLPLLAGGTDAEWRFSAPDGTAPAPRRSRYSATALQRDRSTARQRDGSTARQRDRETA